MGLSARQDLTQLLVAWSEGEADALEKITPVVYQELHKLAHRYMRSERPGHLLQTTALINEAYLRLIDWKNVRWKDRNHFVGICAGLMRRILVDFARSHNYTKRGGRALKVSLTEAIGCSDERDADLVEVDEALKLLEQLDARKSQIVEMRFFGGLSVEEIASALCISKRTVLRDWSLAQAWLHKELNGGGANES